MSDETEVQHMSDDAYMPASSYPTGGERSIAYLSVVRSHAVADEVMRDLAEALRMEEWGLQLTEHQLMPMSAAALARFDALNEDTA